MKILKDATYKELLGIKEELSTILNGNIDLSSVRSNINLNNKIRNICEFTLSTLGTLSELDNDEVFVEKVNKLTNLLREEIGYSFAIIGIKKNNKLIDFEPSFDSNLDEGEVKKSITPYKEIDINKSFVGEIITKENGSFHWDSKAHGDVFNKKNIKKHFPGLNLDDKIKNLKHYFDFFKEIEELVICPLKSFSKGHHSPIGYIILCGREKSDLNQAEKKELFNFIEIYLSSAFESQIIYKHKNKDTDFLGKLYKNYYDSGIKLVLKYFSGEYDLKYSSFWVPTFTENERCFILKDAFSSYLSTQEIEKLGKNNYYKSSDCIIGKVIANEHKDNDPNFRELEVIWKVGANDLNTGIKSFSILKVNQVILIPIYKYFNGTKASVNNNEKIILGIFLLYPKDDLKKSILLANRINIFAQHLVFYLEFALYDKRYHQIEMLTKKLFELLTIEHLDQFYENFVHVINNDIIGSEQTTGHFGGYLCKGVKV